MAKKYTRDDIRAFAKFEREMAALRRMERLGWKPAAEVKKDGQAKGDESGEKPAGVPEGNARQ